MRPFDAVVVSCASPCSGLTQPTFVPLQNSSLIVAVDNGQVAVVSFLCSQPHTSIDHVGTKVNER